MKELLEEFVALAPKEWWASLETTLGINYVLFITDGYGFEGKHLPTRSGGIHLDNDRASAEAIVFLWDYLMGSGQSNGFLYYEGKRWGWEVSDTLTVWGLSRIEALIRACVSLWKVRK